MRPCPMFWSGSLRRFADRCGRSARSAGNGCNFTVWRLFLGGGPVPSGTDRYGRNTGTGPRFHFRPRTRASSLRAGFYRVDYGRRSGKAEFPCTARIRIFPGRIRKNAWSIVSSAPCPSPSRPEWCCKRFKIRCKNEIIAGVNRQRLRKGSSECGARPMRRIGTHGTRGL